LWDPRFFGKSDIRDLKKRTGSLAHSGPDDEGLWYDQENGVYWGHIRLAVFDLECGSRSGWTIERALCIVLKARYRTIKTCAPIWKYWDFSPPSEFILKALERTDQVSAQESHGPGIAQAYGIFGSFDGDRCTGREVRITEKSPAW
jgi:hypothetical protein